MRVLIVGVDLSTFVYEQYSSLEKEGIHIITYKVINHGLIGYLRESIRLRNFIKKHKPDMIHAHYGLCCLCANLQRIVPVISTYHGGDIHSGGWILKLSQLAIWLSTYNIFVSKRILEMSGVVDSKNTCVLPCGIDLDSIQEIPRGEAKRLIGRSYPFVLFSGSFTNDIKNPLLAMESIKKVPEMEIVELKGYSRQEVNLLMNAADCLLMTSLREGSPQVIKEAMACGTPIVSVDVGDVKDVIGDTKGCFIAERNADDIADKLRMALAFKGKTNGRQRIIDLGLSNEVVAKKLIGIYNEVLRK